MNPEDDELPGDLPEEEVREERPREPYMTPEVAAAVQEDPTFPEVLGRARAAARGEPYDPDKHHPHRRVRRHLVDPSPEDEDQLLAVMERFYERGGKTQHYLRLLR